MCGVALKDAAYGVSKLAKHVTVDRETTHPVLNTIGRWAINFTSKMLAKACCVIGGVRMTSKALAYGAAGIISGLAFMDRFYHGRRLARKTRGLLAEKAKSGAVLKYTILSLVQCGAGCAGSMTGIALATACWVLCWIHMDVSRDFLSWLPENALLLAGWMPHGTCTDPARFVWRL
jgi:hypothetical protein